MKWQSMLTYQPKDGHEVLMQYKSFDYERKKYTAVNKDWFIRNVQCWLDETESSPPLDKWIGVEKEYPEIGKWSLLYNGHWIGVGKYDPDRERNDKPEWQDETSEWIQPEPTHWQPLPSAPGTSPDEKDKVIPFIEGKKYSWAGHFYGINKSFEDKMGIGYTFVDCGKANTYFDGKDKELLENLFKEDAPPSPDNWKEKYEQMKARCEELERELKRIYEKEGYESIKQLLNL